MRFFWLLLAAFLLPRTTAAMEYSLGAAHYANVMEFWQQKPQPELIQPLLRTLSEKGQLNRPERQMFLGAFLSRLLNRGTLAWGDFTAYCSPLPAPGKRACAWAAHLGGITAENLRQTGLLDGADAIFIGQLRKTPKNLRQWVVREPAIIQMLWAAFMADGDTSWLAPVLDSALAENSPAAVAKAAAASFWQYAPRHEKVANMLRTRLASADSREKGLLETMLNGAKSR